MLLTDAISDYVGWHQYQNHSPNTVKLVQHDLLAFAQWLASTDRGTTLRALTIANARAFVLELQQRRTVYPNHPNRAPIDRPFTVRTTIPWTGSGSKRRAYESPHRKDAVGECVGRHHAQHTVGCGTAPSGATKRD